jgi:hypothetical protein
MSVCVEMEPLTRFYRGDLATRLHGSQIPPGSEVEVVKFCARRRVLVLYNGQIHLTLLWCLAKEAQP